MAYEAGCTSAPRVNIFSNPDRTYANRPQGTDTDNNARVIREAAVKKQLRFVSTFVFFFFVVVVEKEFSHFLSFASVKQLFCASFTDVVQG